MLPVCSEALPADNAREMGFTTCLDKKHATTY